MSHIGEARMMLDAADKAANSPATRLGWLVLAKGSVAAAITESTKGVKDHSGHTLPGQTSIDDFAGAPIGAEVRVDGNGMVLTPADEIAAPEPDDGDEDDGDDEPNAPDPLADLPTEAEYDAQVAATEQPT